jgi:hypothetical protein
VREKPTSRNQYIHHQIAAINRACLGIKALLAGKVRAHRALTFEIIPKWCELSSVARDLCGEHIYIDLNKMMRFEHSAGKGETLIFTLDMRGDLLIPLPFER